MKLFTVHIEAVAMVWANDEREARRTIDQEISDCVDRDCMTAIEYKAGEAIWADWRDSEPFGDAPEEFHGLTMEEIQEKMTAEDAKVDRDTLQLPGLG